MMPTEELYKIYLQHPVISTDTRKISPDCLFFALKGENFDANTFAERAIEQGASYSVIDNPAYKKGDQYLLVEDVLLALQDLARHHRRQLMIPVVGLTGTNGKTTTKELINAVLSQQFNTYATQGNLNNHIGVPLTVLSINSDHEAAVIEMGANHQKEIELLCSISQPSHGMITNVGKAHLEGFGGVEGVKKGKGELYDFLAPHPPRGGVAFVNCDDPVLVNMALDRGLDPTVYYGESNSSSLVSGKIIDNSPLLTLEWTDRRLDRNHSVKTQLTGEYNLPNILAAICIGLYFGIDPHKINTGISGYQPKNNRSQVTRTSTNTLICDYYNANPSSMAVAIENLGKLTADHKVLVLGDMFEMGDEAAVEHEDVLHKALNTDVDKRFFIGPEFARSRKSEIGGQRSAIFYPTVEEAIEAFKAHPIRNSTVLIKGSRGMALERLVELF
ncbi:MAG TPA: UDP-N-acetylmuramoyl-tripeptide--D-alanyl-D-alanine ligase [Mucilaginibacter sp.]|jgi:UDP-N-acetylmuramoyl-tripeptide--D-alanyl-D-alanine ligase|nr:UDP-N-acetylmuramoyl-tripeptide--D-alanyl-D-alanine ligase [Mucilaginibacter sp.]